MDLGSCSSCGVSGSSSICDVFLSQVPESTSSESCAISALCANKELFASKVNPQKLETKQEKIIVINTERKSKRECFRQLQVQIDDRRGCLPLQQYFPEAIVSTSISEIPVSLSMYQNDQVRQNLFIQLSEKTREIASSISYLSSQYDCNGKTNLDSLLFFSKAEPKVKARFSNVRCPRHTAVAVAGEYIHANFVTAEKSGRIFVASQLPCDPILFWKFIFENKYNILDLCVCRESFYLEELESSSTYGDFIVKLVEKTDVTLDETVYVYEVEDISIKKKTMISRCHYKAWEDHLAAPLSVLHYLVLKLETTFLGNTFINCLAGMGRTGTLIAAYFLKQGILQKEITSTNLETALIDLIISLRKQRGPGFIQTEQQFYLLLDFAIDLLSSLD